jgi:ATP-dependent protease Clp ATPase subunit
MVQAERRCSFCNRPEHEVAKLVAGPIAFICDRCIQIASEVVEHSSNRRSPLAIRAWALKLLERLVRPLRRSYAS